MMLDYLGDSEKGRKIDRALAAVIEKGDSVTKDINKTNYIGTNEFADAVCKELEKE